MAHNLMVFFVLFAVLVKLGSGPTPYDSKAGNQTARTGCPGLQIENGHLLGKKPWYDLKEIENVTCDDGFVTFQSSEQMKCTEDGWKLSKGKGFPMCRRICGFHGPTCGEGYQQVGFKTETCLHPNTERWDVDEVPNCVKQDWAWWLVTIVTVVTVIILVPANIRKGTIVDVYLRFYRFFKEKKKQVCEKTDSIELKSDSTIAQPASDNQQHDTNKVQSVGNSCRQTTTTQDSNADYMDITNLENNGQITIHVEGTNSEKKVTDNGGSRVAPVSNTELENGNVKETKPLLLSPEPLCSAK